MLLTEHFSRGYNCSPGAAGLPHTKPQRSQRVASSTQPLPALASPTGRSPLSFHYDHLQPSRSPPASVVERSGNQVCVGGGGSPGEKITGNGSRQPARHELTPASLPHSLKSGSHLPPARLRLRACVCAPASARLCLRICAPAPARAPPPPG